MRSIICALSLFFVTAVPGTAIEFLGVELCTEGVDTGVILPATSPLSLESAEVGRHGGLVLLLSSKEKKEVLRQVDDLMIGYVGSDGIGDERKLEWSNTEITAFAQVIQKGYVALAVTATEGCTPEGEASVSAAADAAAGAPQPEAAREVPPPTEAVAASAATAAVTAGDGATRTEPAEMKANFELKGRLKHTAAEGDWVDVMGVVVNNSGVSHKVASFDLSLYDGDGELICVDTISVNQLRAGQERAFRGSIRCADYDPAAVVGWKLQFAGGH
jgi:hypothetical protein